MTAITIIDGASAASIDAQVEDGRLRAAPEDVERVLEWELKPEGFCLGPVCYPVPEGTDLMTDAGVDLGGLADLIGRPYAADAEAGAIFLGTSARERMQALAFLDAPDFTLPDLEGELHSLSDYRGQKVLLVAYASW